MTLAIFASTQTFRDNFSLIQKIVSNQNNNNSNAYYNQSGTRSDYITSSSLPNNYNRKNNIISSKTPILTR